MKKYLLLSGTGCALLAPPAAAATLYGTTATRDLVRFDSASPSSIQSTVPITGLTDPSESIKGIDFRPSTGQLYAFASTPGSVYRLYTINTATGVATQVGTDAAEMSGTFWGFDFNPAVDRIRVVNNEAGSLRYNPDSGAIVATDTSLSTNGIAAVAYDRNDTNPATATTLFGINVTTSELVRIGGVDGVPSPNGGVVTAVGLLGIGQVSGLTSMDIYQDGTAYAAFSSGATAPVRGGLPSTGLYTINLTTGAATLVGGIGQGLIITGLAAIPEPGSAAVLSLAALALSARRRRA